LLKSIQLFGKDTTPSQALQNPSLMEKMGMKREINLVKAFCQKKEKRLSKMEWSGAFCHLSRFF